MNANPEELTSRLAEYTSQLQCRRDALAALDQVGEELRGKIAASAFSSLPEVLERRQALIERLERVISQTKDLDDLASDVSRLTSHPSIEVADAANALSRSFAEAAAAAGSVLRTQQECERILADSLVVAKRQQRRASDGRRAASRYGSGKTIQPRFLDSKQ